jgi:clan AA aspartic protease (TIGR02281 family)
MRKRTAVLLVPALLTGWVLGWYSRDLRVPEPRVPRVPVRIMPSPATGVAQSYGNVTAAPPERNDTVRQLLESKAFARAVEHYEALQAQADNTAVQRARGQLLAHASRLTAQADYRSAIQLLQLYLQVDYRDVEARMLLAEAYRGENDLRAAIEQLYEAKGQAWRPEMLEQLTGRIRALVTDFAAALEQGGDTSGLLDLYQDLTQLEPSHAPYFIGLATAQLALADNDGARQSLLLVAQDPEVGARARELLEELRVAAIDSQQPEAAAPATEVAGIPLLRNGNHFLVDARLGSAQQARLLIDTGASLTILTPGALKRRGVAARATGKTGLFTTANGRVSAPIYRLDSLSLGNWQVSNLEVGVLELEDPQFDGLLGMNFLGHFRFFIDQKQARLHLSLTTQPN